MGIIWEWSAYDNHALRRQDELLFWISPFPYRRTFLLDVVVIS